MMEAGQVVLFRFPQTDFANGKLRPAILVGKLPGEFDDWLLCMVSTQLRHALVDFDEVIDESDADYASSGLRTASLIRTGRLAVVQSDILLGAIGQIAPERVERIKQRLADWLLGK